MYVIPVGRRYVTFWLSWSNNTLPDNASWEGYFIFWGSEKRVATLVLWDVTPCNLVEYCRHFGEMHSCGNYLRNVAEFPPHMTPSIERTVLAKIHFCKNLKFYTRKCRLTSIQRPMLYGGNVRSFLIRMQYPEYRLTFKNRASYIYIYIYIYRTGVQLPSKCWILYIFFSTNISTEYFKHAAHSPFFSSKCRLFHNATFFGSCIIHILHTGCAKI